MALPRQPLTKKYLNFVHKNGKNCVAQLRNYYTDAKIFFCLNSPIGVAIRERRTHQRLLQQRDRTELSLPPKIHNTDGICSGR